MTLDMLIFAIMAYLYVHPNQEELDDGFDQDVKMVSPVAYQDKSMSPKDDHNELEDTKV